jgi:hypothetical protein
LHVPEEGYIFCDYALNKSGYPFFSLCPEKSKTDAEAYEVLGVNHVVVHRLTFLAVNGWLPEGGIDSNLTIHHKDQDTCNCAPENLEVLTRTDNIAASLPHGVGYCKQWGHPLRGKNLNNFGGCRYCYHKVRGYTSLSFQEWLQKEYNSEKEIWIDMLRKPAGEYDSACLASELYLLSPA